MPATRTQHSTTRVPSAFVAVHVAVNIALINEMMQLFDTMDIHVHVPEGATPKDGPSAGVGMVTSIVSVLTGIPVRKEVAMTGEVTLRGNVLPIGGLKEKILAAKRAKLTTVILPRRNKKDLEEIPKHLLKGIQLSFADTMDDVMKIALRRKASATPTKKPSSPSTATTRSKSTHSGRRKRDGRTQEIQTALMPRQFSRID